LPRSPALLAGGPGATPGRKHRPDGSASEGPLVLADERGNFNLADPLAGHEATRLAITSDWRRPLINDYRSHGNCPPSIRW